MRRIFAVVLGVAGVGLLLAHLGLPSGEREAQAAGKRQPNVLFVVWDTVRADHLSLYGYSKPTTPHLVEWAKQARVFEDCVSTGSSTIPSHASMFTGLLPTEHGANNAHQVLLSQHVTLAELMRNWGYQTYLFAANPHISAELSFDQGFQKSEHPWEPKYREEAIRIVRQKISPEDRSSELAERLRSDEKELGPWSIKAAGELAQRGLESWLDERDPERPWFAFLNYMEAHRPFIPADAYRRRMMNDAQVARSYQIDRSWFPMWSYVFGLHEYTSEELEVMAASYDATLAELDDLFHALLESLGAKGLLENTVVILTADHGEHLGEHHMLDHQYSLYDGLIRVPLVLWYPDRVPAGREKMPVANFDVFATILELTGVEDPELANKPVQSLLAPNAKRIRISEYPAAVPGPLALVKRAHPQLDERRWQRTLRALVADDFKFIWASNGDHELYDVARDPGETTNLAGQRPDVAKAMASRLDAVVAELRSPYPEDDPSPALSDEQRRRLEALGYIQPGEQGGEQAPR